MERIDVKRRPLGKNGIEISEVSLGAMNLRMLKDLGLARRLVNDILDRGINSIDTARGYNSQAGSVPMIESEVILGEVISAREDIDEPIHIITKGHGYTPEAFMQHFGESTARLQINQKDDGLYIGKTKIWFSYLLHGIKADRWDIISKEGVLELANKYRSEGRFNFFGFSSHYGDAEVIKKAIETRMFNLCELPYNVYNPILAEEGQTDLFKLANEYGMGVINMKAYNGSGSIAIFKQLSDLTNISYLDMTRYCLSNPYVSTIDAGVRSIGEFLMNAEASGMPLLSAEERSAMRDRARRVSPHLNKICRECMHCLEKFECPEGVNFPKMLGVHGRYLVSQSLGFDTSPYRDEFRSASAPYGAADYAAASVPAAVCKKCGECLPWCEYHLNVPELLTQAQTDLG